MIARARAPGRRVGGARRRAPSRSVCPRRSAPRRAPGRERSAPVPHEHARSPRQLRSGRGGGAPGRAPPARAGGAGVAGGPGARRRRARTRRTTPRPGPPARRGGRPGRRRRLHQARPDAGVGRVDPQPGVRVAGEAAAPRADRRLVPRPPEEADGRRRGHRDPRLEARGDPRDPLGGVAGLAHGPSLPPPAPPPPVPGAPAGGPGGRGGGAATEPRHHPEDDRGPDATKRRPTGRWGSAERPARGRAAGQQPTGHARHGRPAGRGPTGEREVAAEREARRAGQRTSRTSATS